MANLTLPHQMKNLSEQMSDTLINKIAESGLITLRPEEWVSSHALSSFDLKKLSF